MSDDLPSGIVSYLFTDVEGSTPLWEAAPPAMSASLAEHDRILRAAIALHNGHVFATGGDAFAAAFHTTTDALEAAVKAQIDLAAASWPGPPITVRMGIHAGEAEERNGDYFGPAVNRAARIMAAANGGQILLSAAAAEMAATWVEGGTSLTDLGVHTLKDFDAPEQLFMVAHDRIPAVDRPIRTGRRRRHNLPDYLTTFVGRNAELGAITDLVQQHRLVTLTGVGGTGKTRLAVEVARRLLPEFRQGCWLVELAPIIDPGNIMVTVGEIFDLRPGPGATIDEVVKRHLADMQVLVLIDNCEHVLESASDVISQLLAAGPGVRVLATSRESLGIPGEAIVRVPSLSLPDPDRPREDAEAVHLFLDRARGVWPDSRPTERDLQAISRICVRIDGIPLGLELAAARLRTLSPADLADRLEESFRVLSGSAKTSLPRQRTLNATIDWSHDLLTADERTVFRRLAMFLNGFDLAAAEAVCSGGQLDSEAVLEQLDSLVDKSLVIPSHHPVLGTRYRMLEPVRQFAQEQLRASGEAETVRMAHARHFADHIGRVSPLLRRAGQMTWERRLDDDYDNIRSAFTALLEAGEIDTHLDMAFDLFPYWQHTGLHFDAIPLIEAGMRAAPPDTDEVRLIKASFTMSALGFETTLPRSVDDSAFGLELAQKTGHPNLIGRMELAHGAAIRHSTTRPDFAEHVLRGRELIESNREPHWWEPEWEDAFHDFLFSGYLPPGDARRREHSERAISTFERLGDEAQLVASLCESAMGMLEGVDEWIAANLRRAVELVEKIDVPYWHGHAYYFSGEIDFLEGRHQAAIAGLRESLSHLEDCGDLSCWAGAMRTMAMSQLAEGAVDEARRTLSVVLRRTPGLPMPERAVPRALSIATRLLLDSGEPRRAAAIIGAGLAGGAQAFLLPELPSFEEMAGEVRSQLGDEAERLLAEGAGVELSELLIPTAEHLAG